MLPTFYRTSTGSCFLEASIFGMLTLDLRAALLVPKEHLLCWFRSLAVSLNCLSQVSNASPAWWFRSLTGMFFSDQLIVGGSFGVLSDLFCYPVPLRKLLKVQHHCRRLQVMSFNKFIPQSSLRENENDL